VPDPGTPLDPAALGAVFRAEHGRVVATLTRQLGSLELAEDAAQEAYVVALQAWPEAGLPPNPGGWLVTTARRKAIDRLRRESVRDIKHEQAQVLTEDPGPDAEPPGAMALVDDRLRMIFTCCHPALEPAAQVALTLKVLGGLSTAEVAAAFLVEEAAMAKRLTRTRRKIAAARIPYRVPRDAELPGRVRGVLATLYLIYNEGYRPGGADPAATRPELTGEAIRLARLVVELMPDEAEALGLLALLLLTEARQPARVVDGRLVTLAEQDRTRWDRAMVDEGHALVRACLRRGRPGRYQLLAAVNAVHTDAARAELTDWGQIVALYDQLYAVEPTPVVGLNRAVAVAERDGPAAGLAALDALPGLDTLDRYGPLHATRAELFRRLGDAAAADAAYGRALDLAPNPAERRYLEAQRAGLE
jgi:RNA polymerase sigma-70 factor (ECF subfamily)